MTVTPHSILGVSNGASADEIRTARRELARVHHPDAGGDAAVMQQVNAAAAQALRLLDAAGETAAEVAADPAELAEEAALLLAVVAVTLALCDAVEAVPAEVA